MADVRLRIVGECVIEIGARRLEPDAPHLFALLLYVATECGRNIPRAELCELFFPDQRDVRAASHNLRQLLYRLRRLGAPIVLDQCAISLDASRVRCAADELTQGSLAERKRSLSGSYTVLPHYSALQSKQLAEWVDGLRDRLHTALRRRLSDDLQIARKKADWRWLELIARRTLELDPLNESATLGLAEAVARTGSKTMAMGILETYELELGDDARSLALPAQLLRKRIGDTAHTAGKFDTTSVPLVGRCEEMAELAATWARARGGYFCTIAVTGEKSVGKSRLVEEFAAIIEMDGSGSILTVRLTPPDRERPLALFADLAKQLLVLPGAAACDSDSLPVLGRLSGAPTPSGPISGEPSQACYEDAAVRRAVCNLFECVSHERPFICWVDDADDLDPASWEFLAAVQKRLPAGRILFVLCGQRALSGTTELRLPPLDEDATRDLLDVLLVRTETHIGEQQVAWCLETAAGNPGHLELLLRQASYAWHPDAIPRDLIALADQRIADLSTEAQYALQAIAVLGDGALPRSIATLTGLDSYPLLTALHELGNASLIVQGTDGIRCRTAFIADRTTRTASSIALSVMHDRAAALLEQQNVDRPLSQSTAWRIASHWKRAGQAKRARECLRACWQQAVEIGQPMVACNAIREALLAAATPEEQAELLDDLIGAMQMAGAMHLVADAVEERSLLSPRIRDSEQRIAALAFDRVEALTLHQDSVARGIEALRAHLHSPLLDPARRVRAARLLMIASDVMIDESLARETFSTGQRIQNTDSHSALLQLHLALIYHSSFGDPDEALRTADRLEESVRHRERSWYTFVSRRNCSLSRQLVGDGAPDYEAMETLYAECMEASMIANALKTASYLTTVLIDDGEIEAAKRWVREAERLAEDMGASGLATDYLTAQIDLALIEGDARRARQFAAALRIKPGLTLGRLANDVFIYGLRVRQSCDDAPASETDIAELLRFHYAARRFGRHDDHMDVLWVALRSVGRVDEASNLLAEYLSTHRRERRTCRYILRQRTGADPAWVATSARQSAVSRPACYKSRARERET